MRRGLLIPALALALGLCACGHGAPSQTAQPPEPDQEAVSAVKPLPQPEPEPEPEPEPQPPSREERARALLAGMTDRELVGQLFLVRWPETGAAELAEEYCLGGYILFGREFKNNTPAGVREMIAACQNVSSIPMLMAVDEEGGSVVRPSRYPAFRAQPFQSPRAVYAAGGLEGLEEDAREKSAFLLDLGLNVNLAPVCDVSTDPDSFIYDRTLGLGAEETAEYVSAVVRAMEESGVGSVLKHFPGYGGSGDTHTGAALDSRPLEEFLEHDLLPFRAGAEAGAGGVLVCHNTVACLDPDRPASLSPAAYRLLREEVGFQGVAMTDDLDMAAIQQCAGADSAAVLALSAGADLVLTGDPRGQIPQVLAALEAGSLSRERLEQAAARVLVWKMDLGLIPVQE